MRWNRRATPEASGWSEAIVSPARSASISGPPRPLGTCPPPSTGLQSFLCSGTGIGRRDSTVETLQTLFEKTLPGFGELFRALSYKEIGSAAMMSRATAGTYQGMILFALPGSPQAVRLGMQKLILPELGHAVRELTR
jgi:hypothetical protein